MLGETTVDVTDQLARLGKLRTEGVLTDDEFQKLKTKLISGAPNDTPALGAMRDAIPGKDDEDAPQRGFGYWSKLAFRAAGAILIIVVAVKFMDSPEFDTFTRSIASQVSKEQSSPDAQQSASTDALSCSSDETRKMIVNLANKNPPASLANDAVEPATRKCNVDNSDVKECLAESINQQFTLQKQVEYSVHNIRLESQDSTTGAIVCDATLHAALPQRTDGADEEISYKLEKMEDGGTHIDLQGLK